MNARRRKKSRRRRDDLLIRRDPAELNLTVRSYTPTASTLNTEARTVEATIATESPVLALDMRSWEVVDEILLMRGVDLPKQVPLLDSHDRSSLDKIAGSVRNLRIEDSKLAGTHHLRESGAGAAAFELIKGGHLTDNSVGYRIDNYVTIPAGKSRTINGVRYSASPERPRRVVTKWTLKENSLLAIGADETAKNRGALQPPKETRTMKKFKEWLEARGFDYDELNDEQRTGLRPDFDAEQEAANNPAPASNPPASNPPAAGSARDALDADLARDTGVKLERDRCRQIRELAGNDPALATLVTECVERGDSVNVAQGIFLEAIRAARPNVGSPAIHVHDVEATRTDLEVGLLLGAGMQESAEKEFDEQALTRGEKFRDTSLLDLCARSLIMDQQPVPHARDEMIRAATSSMSLPYILGNVANKSMLDGYHGEAQTWREWCTIGSVKNFQTVTRARLTDSDDLVKVNNAGEVASGSAQEEYEQFAAATYAKTFAITRTNIINDDLGAFTKTPQRMGRRAASKIADIAYEHFMANAAMSDSGACFHANHSNLNTSNALDNDGLAAGLVAFMKQTDADGQSINVSAYALLVPPDLLLTARGLIESELMLYGAAGTTDATSQVPAKNVLKGTLKKVVAEPRLSNSGYTNYSTSTWYMTSSGSVAENMEIAFLNGKSEPTVERFQQDPSVLGIIFRVLIDFGVKNLDQRNMQKNTA